jgi:hypothetical protein
MTQAKGLLGSSDVSTEHIFNILRLSLSPPQHQSLMMGAVTVYKMLEIHSLLTQLIICKDLVIFRWHESVKPYTNNQGDTGQLYVC